MRFVEKELLLTTLLILYAILTFLDPSLIKRSLNLIDWGSLSTIISLFIISRGLELSGLFGKIAPKIVSFSKGSEVKLLILIALISALSSTVIMNDTAIFIFVPLALTISRIAEIDIAKIVTIIAIAANVGSALTPIGNPQNIIIWRNYHVPFWKFIICMLPFVSLWILILLFLILMSGKKAVIEIPPIPKIRVKRRLIFTSLFLLIITIFLAESKYPIFGLVLTVLVMLIVSREAIFSLDAGLIAIFALIFVDFKEISTLISFGSKISHLSPESMILLSAFLSQIVSNVPSTVMLLSAKPSWLPLAIGINLGGTGLIIGSLANFIAIRLSGISLKRFHKLSLPFFLLALFATLLSYIVIF